MDGREGDASPLDRGRGPSPEAGPRRAPPRSWRRTQPRTAPQKPPAPCVSLSPNTLALSCVLGRRGSPFRDAWAPVSKPGLRGCPLLSETKPVAVAHSSGGRVSPSHRTVLCCRCCWVKCRRARTMPLVTQFNPLPGLSPADELPRTGTHTGRGPVLHVGRPTAPEGGDARGRVGKLLLRGSGFCSPGIRVGGSGQRAAGGARPAPCRR